MSTTDDKKARARKWVNGYTVAGTAVVVAVIIPGTTSTALAAMEAHMCYAIGKIYKGEDYTMKEAVAVARIVGLVAIAAPMVALEAANAVPIAGWAVKGTIAGGVGKTAGRTVERDEFKRHFLRDGHHHLLELGFRAEADEPDFAAGRVLGEVRRLKQRVARPRIEDGGQHHFIFQRRPGGRGDGFKRLQRIGNDAAANNNLIGCAHKISGWPRKGAKGAKELFSVISLQRFNRLQCPFDALVLGFVGGAEIRVLQLAHQMIIQASVRPVVRCRCAAAFHSSTPGSMWKCRVSVRM